MRARFFSSLGKTTRLQLLLAAALAFGALAFRFGGFPLYDGIAEPPGWRWIPFSTAELARTLTIQTGYWMIAATAVLFGIMLLREVRARWPGWPAARAQWPGLLVAVLGAAFWQVHEPHEFKVLFDEHVLAGTAYNMHFERKASFPSGAHFVNGRLVTLNEMVDKRPLLYPFVVALAHDLTGYRAANSYIVNGVLGAVLLLLVYAAGAMMGGWRIGCLGQVLLVSLPLLAQNATAGGFDLLNTTLLSALLLLAVNYWRQPGAGGLDLFALGTALIANARYESLLYFAAFALLVALKWARERQVVFTWLAACVPLLAVSPLLINQVFVGSAHNFQTAEENFINLRHLPKNFFHAIYYLFSTDPELTNSVLLSVAGVVGLLFFLVRAGSRAAGWWRTGRWELPLLVLVLFILANTFLALNLNWGMWDDPMVSRFSLPLQLAFVWCVMAVAVWLLGARPLPGWALGAAAVAALALAAPISARAGATKSYPTYVASSWTRRYVNAHADSGVLLVGRSTLLYILDGHPAITLARVNFSDQPQKLTELVELGLYREVWVIQEMEINRRLNAWIERNDSTADARLDHRFVLETIAEYPYSLFGRLRISRVVGFDPTRAPGLTVLSKPATEASAAEKPSPFSSYLLTQRPEGEPPAVPTLTEFPDSRGELERQLMERLP